jgi:hypothetical protein
MITHLNLVEPCNENRQVEGPTLCTTEFEAIDGMLRNMELHNHPKLCHFLHRSNLF